MQVIGLTGGVGCGKSTVAAVLRDVFGAVLLITDEIGHLAMKPGEKSYDAIVGTFGEDICREDGTIDRNLLGAKVFGDEEALEKLNGIIHPFVKEYIARVMEKEQENDGLLVIESALLLETGLDLLCGQVWYVQAAEEVRRRRLKDSRGYTDEKMDAIMKEQLPEEVFLARSHVVLHNNGDVAAIREQIELLLESVL